MWIEHRVCALDKDATQQILVEIFCPGFEWGKMDFFSLEII